MTTSLATSPDTPNALPSAWIDRLFDRFAAMYGRHWFDLWADVPMADVKDAWRTDLAKVSGDQIRRALEHCRTQCKFPPTLPEFVSLCRAFVVAPDRLALPAPRGEIPPDIAAGIGEARGTKDRRDPLHWAHEVLRLDAEGMYPSQYGVRLAREALGIVA